MKPHIYKGNHMWFVKSPDRTWFSVGYTVINAWENYKEGCLFPKWVP